MSVETTDNDPVYTRSNGARVRVRDMAFPHLKSAHAKLAAEFPGHPELPGMAAEIARRDAEYAAQQAALQTTPIGADQSEDPFQ